MSTEERVPLLYKVVYGSGEWSGSITGTARSLFLLYFLVSVVGLRPVHVGWIMLIGRFWDGINDPIVGTLSDRLRTPWGRRRPLMLVSAIPLGLCFGLLWTKPNTDNDAWLIVYFVVVSIALDTVLTVFGVPHIALLAEVTDDYHARSSYTVWRNAFAVLGSLVIGVSFTWLAEDLFGQADILRGYRIAGWIFGVSLMIAPVLIAVVIRKTATAPVQARPLNPLLIFRRTFRNRPFRLLTLSYFLAFSGLEVLVITFLLYLQIVLRAPDGFDPIMLATLLGAALITMPLTRWLMQRWGKKRAYIWMGITWSATVPLIALFPAGAVNLFIPFSLWLGFIYGAGTTVPWAMLPDVMEHAELETGERNEGTFAAYMAFFRKLGSGLVSLCVGFVLDQAGFIEGTAATNVAQPPAVALALRLVIGILATLLVLLAVAAIRKYPITQTYHEALKKQLRARRLRATEP